MTTTQEKIRAQKKLQELQLRLSYIEKELAHLKQKTNELTSEKGTIESNLELINNIFGENSKSVNTIQIYTHKLFSHNPSIRNYRSDSSQEGIMDQIIELISRN